MRIKQSSFLGLVLVIISECVCLTSSVVIEKGGEIVDDESNSSSITSHRCPPGYNSTQQDCRVEKEKLELELRRRRIIDDAVLPSSLIEEFESVISSSNQKTNKGNELYSFFHSFTSSQEFQRHYWQQYPLVLSTGIFPDSSFFTLEADVHDAFRQNDDEFFAPLQASLKHFPHTWMPKQQQKEGTISWEEFQKRLKKQTVHFDEAGTQFFKLGALNRLITHAIGLPTVLNMYISPMGLLTSTPIHTDAQDIFVIPMMEGKSGDRCSSKRWKVYAPPTTVWNKDPYNRGKVGDVLNPTDLNLLVDVILNPGDVLYIPAGFPHATDTDILCTSATDAEEYHKHYSLHLTVGIESHFWALTYAHLRWCLLSRYQLDISNLTVESPGHWKSMNTLPFGVFFSSSSTEEQMIYMENELRMRMVELEPKRWGNGNEVFPKSSQIRSTIAYYLEVHMVTIMALYDEMFHITKEMNLQELQTRQMRCKQLQSYIMKEFWTFAKDQYMLQYYNPKSSDKNKQPNISSK